MPRSAKGKSKVIVPAERVERGILLIRGHRIMIDSDLADLYGVTTKALNQAVKRNAGRFPSDFVFRLTAAEKMQVVTNCDHLARLKFSTTKPRAFTEHGALMAATVLNSACAEEMSIFIVRAFVRLRKLLAENAGLARRLDDLESKYDGQFAMVFDAIRALMEETAEDSVRPKIGYETERKQ